MECFGMGTGDWEWVLEKGGSRLKIFGGRGGGFLIIVEGHRRDFEKVFFWRGSNLL